uniref:Uncharacterized protein n=1 Tax=Amphilophus citrinellus TaxID=61819 RepID=A0A3Q0S2X1_AMPCI
MFNACVFGQQKQKERKRLEKQEKLNPEENEECPEKKKPTVFFNKFASAKDTDTSDSSDDESSDEDDVKECFCSPFPLVKELDMTSTFVRKAALIAKHKLEQKPRPEKKEKKKISDKEEYKTVPEKSNEEKVLRAEERKHGFLFFFSLVMGNKYASDGNFNKAVKYFTDAIKHNPKEFKLFGNRSFCFEKLQEYEKALMDAELSLGICPGWVKGLYRKGRALAGLKRYEEAALAFMEVLKLDSSCAEAAQELMRVQITQLMECGFTREQSSNALIIHGTVEKALEVLSKLNNQPVTESMIANLFNKYEAVILFSLLLCLHFNYPNPHCCSVVRYLFKVNTFFFFFFFFFFLFSFLNSLLSCRVGVVYSVKVLTAKRCAFVNFTKQEHCDEAIQRFHVSAS